MRLVSAALVLGGTCRRARDFGMYSHLVSSKLTIAPNGMPSIVRTCFKCSRNFFTSSPASARRWLFSVGFRNWKHTNELNGAAEFRHHKLAVFVYVRLGPFGLRMQELSEGTIRREELRVVSVLVDELHGDSPPVCVVEIQLACIRLRRVCRGVKLGVDSLHHVLGEGLGLVAHHGSESFPLVSCPLECVVREERQQGRRALGVPPRGGWRVGTRITRVRGGP
mmetsp:Transcript_41801/g.129136  ORF Transcript_41801/g.129136 Transcript_41801/m.129136 type:complete len:223 (-) Transcript_41801:144-812(-)